MKTKNTYICTGSCKARVSEKEYNEGLTKCGANTCTMFGKPFEKRLMCGVCEHLYKEHEQHKHM